MSFDEYQHEALKYLANLYCYDLFYGALGLAEETGEVVGKIKKILRDKNGIFSSDDVNSISKEIGDVLWYCSLLTSCLGLPFDKIALDNLNKLQSRMERGVLSGSGDDR